MKEEQSNFVKGLGSRQQNTALFSFKDTHQWTVLVLVYLQGGQKVEDNSVEYLWSHDRWFDLVLCILFCSFQVATRVAMTNPCENSCCIVVKNGFWRQGILLSGLRDGQQAYWLLTCHHLISSREASVGFSVYVYNGEQEEHFQLNNDNIERFHSCCGKDGILGEAEHSAYHMRAHCPPRCPFDLDFTVMKLIGVEEVLSGIKLVTLNLSLKASDALVNGSISSLLMAPQCCLYQRSDKLYHEKCYFPLPQLVPNSQNLNVDILGGWGYNMSHLNVVIDEMSGIGHGSSGAPLYATSKSGNPFLIGMHAGTGGTTFFGIKALININLLWVIQLIKIKLKDNYIHQLSSHVLWAIFLQYDKAESKIKDNSLLLRVAEVIEEQLHQSPKEQLGEEEKKMFKKIENFRKS